MVLLPHCHTHYDTFRPTSAPIEQYLASRYRAADPQDTETADNVIMHVHTGGRLTTQTLAYVRRVKYDTPLIVNSWAAVSAGRRPTSCLKIGFAADAFFRHISGTG